MTTTDSNDAPAESAWAPCAPGTLGGLNRRLRAERSRPPVGAKVATAVAATTAIAIGLVAFSPNGWLAGNRITCAQCVQLMPAYHQQLVGGEPMPASDSEAVALHLDSCPRCRAHFESEYPGVLAPSAAVLGLLAITTRRSLWRRPRLGRQASRA